MGEREPRVLRWRSSVDVTGADVQAPQYAETPRPSRPSPAPTLAAQLATGDPAATHLSAFSEVLGPLPVHASVDSPKPRRQAAAPVRGGATPRARGRLSAAAGCGEHTARWSPTVTTTQSTRLSEPWQRHSEARAAARAEAVAARSVPARLDVGDCDSAPGLLGGRFRASTITCCMGTGRTEGRCDLDHAAVAWPRVAVISSLPAHALLPIVRSGSQIRGAARLWNACASSGRAL